MKAKTYQETMDDIEKELRICARLLSQGNLTHKQSLNDKIDELQKQMIRVALDRATEIITNMDSGKLLAQNPR